MKNTLKNRRFQLETLEERTLLAVDAGLAAAYNPAEFAAAEPEAKSLVVTTLADTSNEYDHETTLREAINYANSNSYTGSEAVITFAEGLSGTIDVSGHGKLSIGKEGRAITIDGGDAITVDGGGKIQIFSIFHDCTVTFKNIVITNGYVTGKYTKGGAVTSGSNSNITLEHVTVSNSYCEALGAGVYCADQGSLTVKDSSFIGNTTKGTGGAVMVNSQATAKFENVTFTGNNADKGSAFYASTSVKTTMTNCIITGNTGFSCVDFDGSDSATLTNLVLSGNNASPNGQSTTGVLHLKNLTATIKNITVSNNTGLALSMEGWANCSIYNSIFVKNTLLYTIIGSNVKFAANTNLCSSEMGTNCYIYNAKKDLFAADGYTLAGDSQARNKGNNDYAVGPYDAAGNDRIINGTVDLGACEQTITITGYTNYYDGQQHAGAVISGPYDNCEYSYDGEVWSTTVPMYKDAGSYPFWVHAWNNTDAVEGDNVTAQVTCVITSQITVDDYNEAYDGQEHSIIVEGIQPGDTVLYSTNGSTFDLTEAPAYKFGVHEVYVKVSRAGHPDFYDSATVNIRQKEIMVYDTMAEDKEYDGTTYVNILSEVEMSDIVAGDDVVVTTSGAFPDSVPDYYNIPYTITLSGEDAQYYELNITDGYAGATIFPASIEDVYVSECRVKYDGQLHTITVEGTQPGDTVLYSADDETYVQEAPSYKFGEHIVYVKVTRPYHYDYSSCGVVSISKADLKVTSTVNSKYYDGTTKAIVNVVSVAGVVPGDDVSVATATGEFPSSLPGKYQVEVSYTLTGEDAGYYNAPATSCDAEIIALDIEDVTVNGYSAKYDGAEHTITVSGTQLSDVVVYSADGVTYDLTEAPAYKFGEHTVYVKVSRVGYNDYYSSASVSISKADLSASPAVISRDYDGTTDAEFVTGEVTGIYGDDEVVVTAVGEYPDSLPGDYEVPYTCQLSGKDAGYYNAPASGTSSGTIYALDIEDVVVSNVTVNYDALPHSIYAAGFREGDVVTYTYNDVTTSENPTFIGKGTEDCTYDVTVDVDRVGYNHFQQTATLTIVAPEGPELPSLVVTTLNDIVDQYDLKTSLREALAYAAVYEGGDAAEVTFAEGLSGTIVLNGKALEVAAGAAKIIVDGGNAITVDANAKSGVFTISGIVTLKNIVITNGAAENGAGIYNSGTLALDGVTVSNSSAVKYGGAVYNKDSLTVSNSTFAGNKAASEEAYGGAVFTNKNASASFTSVVFSGNSADYGAGYYAWTGSTSILTDVTFTENTGISGAAVRGYSADITLVNVLAVGNTDTNGSAVCVYGGTTTARNITVADNIGGGVQLLSSGTLYLYNSILVGNSGGDFSAESTKNLNADYNLSSEYFGNHFIAYDSAKDLFAEDGYTLAGDSQARDAGLSEYVTVETDLAGNDRIINGIVDLGAYEQTITAVGYTGVFDGSAHEAAILSGPYTGYMYSLDGENWNSDPLMYRDAGTYTFYVWAWNDVGEVDDDEMTAQVTCVITPLQLTVEGSYVKDHGYDGTTDAEVVVGTVETLYDEGVTVTAAGTFASPEIGTWDVEVTYTVTGDKAGNYIAPVSETLTGQIKPKEAPSMVVTTADDVVCNTDGLISLREALTVYYGTGGCTTVTFDDGLTTINVDSEFTLNKTQDGLVIEGGDDIVFDGENFAIFYVTKDVNVTFSGLTFQNITNSGFGAALRCDWGMQDSNFSDKITFNGCDFIDNKGAYGAAVMLTGITGVFTDCTFSGNSGAYGAVWQCYGNLSIDGCAFTGNTSSSTGGAFSATADNDSLWIEVKDSTFSGNTASSQGGAIYTELAKLTITDSEFTGNSGSAGGAISATHWGRFTQNLSPVVITIDGTTFSDNKAKGNGGAINAVTPQFIITNSEFISNTAAGDLFSRAGAIYTENSVGTSTITDTFFQGNEVHGSMSSMGGALFLATTGWVSGSNYVITGCDFIENAAGADALYYGYGGAGYIAGTTTFKDCSFTGNSAYIADDNDGDGEVKGGALYIVAGGDKVQLWNCTVTDNYAGGNAEGSTAVITDVYGAGIYTDSPLDIVQCLIADNTLYGAAKACGAGLAVGSAPVAVYYSTIAGNEVVDGAEVCGGGIYSKGAVTVLYSIVTDNSASDGADVYNAGTFAFQGSAYNADGIFGTYTADENCYAIQTGDILFADGSYELAENSVAYDGTKVATVPFAAELGGFDLNGEDNYRLCGAYVDYGCYEYQVRDVPSAVVTTSEDVINDHDGVISFREAIAYAVENSVPVTFAEDIETVYIADWVVLDSAVTIEAEGVTFTMKDDGIHGALNITAGSETDPVAVNGGTFTGFNDGAIMVKGTGYATINGTKITQNTADFATSVHKANGAAIYNEGTVLIDNAFIAGNASYREGDASWGALFNNAGASMAVSNSVVAGNYAGCGAGLTNCRGTLVLYNCTVAGNWSWYDSGASFGEAIFGYDALGYGGVTLVYNTISTDNVGGNANVGLNNSYTGENAGYVAGPSYGETWDAEAWKAWDLRLSGESEAINIGDNSKAKTAADSSVLISKDLAGENRICDNTVDAGAYEYTVVLTVYKGTFDGQSHFGISELYAPTGYDTVMYSIDGENWTDDKAVITFRDAGSYDIYVWIANSYVDTYLQDTVVISALQLTVEGSWVEPNLPGVAEAWVRVGTVKTFYDDGVTVTATGTFQSTEIGKGIPVDVQYQVSGEKAGNYIAPVDEVLYGDINEAEAASMVVTTDRDVVNAADGLISLREALTVYYGTGGCTTVTFAEGLTTINVESEFALSKTHNGLVVDGGGDIVFDGEEFAIFCVKTDMNLTFNGLTFQNITNSGFGAALRCTWDLQEGGFSDKITFSNCNFNSNKGAYGAAVMLTGITGVFTDCNFTSNSGAYGAVWQCYGNLSFDGCTFTGNTSSSTGGAFSATADNDSLWIEVKNSTFKNNTASKQGGAVYTELAKLTITDSEFTGNSGSAGGAVSATHWDRFTQNLSPVVITIDGTTFDGNKAKGNGGAINAVTPQFIITDSEFTNNTAAGDFFSRAGAIYTENSVAASTITDTLFKGNEVHGTASSMGGALFLATTGWGSGGNYVITGCDFIENTAGADALYYGYGGAGYIAGTTTFKDCSFTGNSAYIADDNDGNGDVKGGALYIVAGGDKVQLWNSTVTGNYAGGNAEGSTAVITDVYGAGIYTDSALDIIQCLIADNTLYGAAKAYGAGLAIGSAPVSIWHSTIAGNEVVDGAEAYGGGIYSKGAVTALYSIVADNSANKGADLYNVGSFAFKGSVYDAEAIFGSYTADAACVALTEGDALFADDSYQLASRSVAIDSTGVSKVFTYEEDLAGNPRLQGFCVDAGCYEYQGAKVYVCVTLSDTIPNMEESAELPVSITEAEIGSTVYAQVWVKNMDDCTAGISGGYTDIKYSSATADYVAHTASSLYSEYSDLASAAIEGTVSAFGGNAAQFRQDLGIDSWALLGYVEFTVTVFGEVTVKPSDPTFGGEKAEYLDMSRFNNGAVAAAGIEYWGSTLTVVKSAVAAPTLTAVTSAGANIQKASWNVVKGAPVKTYELAYTVNGTDWTIVQTTSDFATISGLTYGTNVTYKVRALSSSDMLRDSDWSNEITLNVCPMDIDGDGFIGAGDYAIFSASFFTNTSYANWDPRADIDGDGFIGPADYSYLGGNWLKSVSEEDLIYPPAKAAADEVFASLDFDELAVDLDIF